MCVFYVVNVFERKIERKVERKDVELWMWCEGWLADRSTDQRRACQNPLPYDRSSSVPASTPTDAVHT